MDTTGMAARARRVPGVVWAAVALALWGMLSTLSLWLQEQLISAAAGGDVGGPRVDARWVGLRCALAVLGVAVVVATRRWPVLMYLLVVVLAVLPGFRTELWNLASSALVVVAGYHLGRRAPGRAAIPLGLLGTLVQSVAGTWSYSRALASGFQGPVPWPKIWLVNAISHTSGTAATFLLPVICGLVVRHEVARADQMTERLAQERAEQAVRVAEAVRADRERVAHELHDLAAHHTTAVVINAKAARKVSTSEPQLLPGLMDDIVEESRGAQSSLRQMVRVLHEPDDVLLAPQPTLDELPALLDRSRRINPDLVAELSPVEVPPAVALAAYRIVQESLTNCHRYAPGAPVTVFVGPEGDELVVQVRNGRSNQLVEDSLGTGHGIEGMRMRAEALDGSLEAGPEGRGWQVTAWLPLHPGAGEQDIDQEEAE